MIICAIMALFGVICVIFGLICSTDSARKHQRAWTVVVCVGVILFIVGWVGGLTILDIEEDAIRTEYEYVYNYCPHCGERLKD